METEFDDDYGFNNRAGERANAYMVVESSKFAPVLVALACVSMLTSGIAVGLSVWSMNSYDRSYKELERENRLLQLKVDDMRVALNSQGIKTNKHAQSESP